MAAGKRPWPEEVPQDEAPAIRQALENPPAPDQVYCIKTHFEVPVGKPYIRIICNYRDVRDAMLSYMRFMKCSFDKALSVARGSMKITNHYLEQKHPDVLPVRYDDIISSPQETIRLLAKFLSLTVTDKKIEDIARSLSREEVRRHLENMESQRTDAETAQEENGQPGALTTAQNLDGSVRVYDHATGFQTNHISSNSDGEWREVFSNEEKERLMAVATDWLQRYNFIP